MIKLLLLAGTVSARAIALGAGYTSSVLTAVSMVRPHDALVLG